MFQSPFEVSDVLRYYKEMHCHVVYVSIPFRGFWRTEKEFSEITFICFRFNPLSRFLTYWGGKSEEELRFMKFQSPFEVSDVLSKRVLGGYGTFVFQSPFEVSDVLRWTAKYHWLPPSFNPLSRFLTYWGVQTKDGVRTEGFNPLSRFLTYWVIILT